MTPWVSKADDISWKRNTASRAAITDDDPVNARILKLATDLGNTVLAKKAANDLQASVSPGLANQGHTLTSAQQYQVEKGSRL